MQAGNPSDEQLWEVCRKLPSDFEPYGQRKWPGRREERLDCATCCWFVELFRPWPDWGVCANPQSPRAALLTFAEQGCWQHEPEKRPGLEQPRRIRCGFRDRFERFLREEAANFIREEVRKANDPMSEEEPATPTPGHIRRTALFVVVRRLLRHADEDFRCPAFDEMVARARKDTRRYGEFARCHLARTVQDDVSGIRLPGNVRELEDKFWRRVDAIISEALEGRRAEPN